jgi:hypothetical protein
MTSLWTLERSILPSGTDEPLQVDKPLTDRLPELLPDLLVSNWMLWIPAQAINFRFTPVKFQVLFTNIVALVWNSYLSFSTRQLNDKDKPTE